MPGWPPHQPHAACIARGEERAAAVLALLMGRRVTENYWGAHRERETERGRETDRGAPNCTPSPTRSFLAVLGCAQAFGLVHLLGVDAVAAGAGVGVGDAVGCVCVVLTPGEGGGREMPALLGVGEFDASEAWIDFLLLPLAWRSNNNLWILPFQPCCATILGCDHGCAC